MSEFSNVTLIREANVYFDGAVTSRTVIFTDGTKKTLGIMMPGEYEFGTDQDELMEVMAGEMDVLLPEADDWQTFAAGTQFAVPANSKFSLKVTTLVDYCCSYS